VSTAKTIRPKHARRLVALDRPKLSNANRELQVVLDNMVTAINHNNSIAQEWMDAHNGMQAAALARIEEGQAAILVALGVRAEKTPESGSDA
jgi:hypothetical protein